MTTLIESNRRGVICIAEVYYERQTELVQTILAQALIVRCEHMYASRTFEFVVYHPELPELAVGEESPFYNVIVDNNLNTFRFQRK